MYNFSLCYFNGKNLGAHFESSCRKREQKFSRVGAVPFSSIASPICQEGQSERNFQIFTFSSRFFVIFPRFFLIFFRFPAIFSLSGVALCPPLATPVATPLVPLLLLAEILGNSCFKLVFVFNFFDV